MTAPPESPKPTRLMRQWSLVSSIVLFFFQAEDGIRGGHVTGVQTCALPISDPLEFAGGHEQAGQVEAERLRATVALALIDLAGADGIEALPRRGGAHPRRDEDRKSVV